MPAPRHDYAATLDGDRRNGARGSRQRRRGIAAAASASACRARCRPASGLVQNANSTWLNGRPFARDLEARLGRPVRLANDANCFALSEAVDGAGAGAPSVFGVILGTGCGGGLVLDGRLIDGPRGIGGEWGHNPLPWATADEHPGPACWCGRNGCMETWVSGPGLEADHARATGEQPCEPRRSWPAPAAAMRRPRRRLDRHASRLARGLAHVVNILDPARRRARRRPLAAAASLRRCCLSLIAPHLFTAHAGVTRQAAALGRCQRRPRRGVAVGKA